jgi:hypothetical protein
MGEACRAHGRDEKCIQNFGGNPEGKRMIGSHTRRWEGNIKMHIKKIRLEGVGLIQLAQGRDRDSCEPGYEPSGSMKSLGFLTT